MLIEIYCNSCERYFRTRIDDIDSFSCVLCNYCNAEIIVSKQSLAPGCRIIEDIPEKVDVFGTSALFSSLDTHVFDNNAIMYSKKICPYCSNPLKKVPSAHAKCPTCKQTIYSKNSIFSKEKLLLTESGVELLNSLRKQRINRNFIYKYLRRLEISEREFIEMSRDNNLTYTETLVFAFKKQVFEHSHCFDVSHISSDYQSLGDICKKYFDIWDALKYFLCAFYIDFMGYNIEIISKNGKNHYKC
ncbi:MAG: hypothetical protein ACI38A_03370, partial [Candidatus Ornithomonoglobus sp.]